MKGLLVGLVLLLTACGNSTGPTSASVAELKASPGYCVAGEAIIPVKNT